MRTKFFAFFAAAGLCLLANHAFAELQPVNPAKVKTDKVYTGAWNGYEGRLLLNGNLLWSFNSNIDEDLSVLNDILLRAQGKTLLLNTDVLKELASGSGDHDTQIHTLFAILDKPFVEPDADQKKNLEQRVSDLESEIFRLNARVKALEQRK